MYIRVRLSKAASISWNNRKLLWRLMSHLHSERGRRGLCGRRGCSRSWRCCWLCCLTMMVAQRPAFYVDQQEQMVQTGRDQKPTWCWRRAWRRRIKTGIPGSRVYQKIVSIEEHFIWWNLNPTGVNYKHGPREQCELNLVFPPKISDRPRLM